MPPREFPVTLSLLRTARGAGVAAARVTFLDVPPREWEMALRPDEDLFIPLDSHFTVELPSTEAEPNLIAFRAGQGDGAYPVWIGRTDDGQVRCVVVDFRLLSSDGGE
ncbi:DUF4241 domain-containing protein [Streptomyces sp. NPDC059104]|uniref:DUF4241 domain-containing protein n=1 Tax=Streptomyces sp. NPDC059104 TaxID=3346729 RepID=UPI00369323CF